MVRLRSVLSVLCLLFVLFAIGEARRYSYRYYRASYRYYYRYSYYRSSYYSSTTSLTRRYSSSIYRHGTSPYTRSNWYYYGSVGSVYGYNRYIRTRRYYDSPDDMPTVCENNYDNSPNGTVYGYFICPREGEDDDMDQCCGADQQEYCCRQGDDPGMIIGIVVGSLIGVGVLAGVSYFVFKVCCQSSGSKKKTEALSPKAPRNTVAPARTSLITVTTNPEPMQTTSFSTAYDPKYPPPSAIYNDPAYPPNGAGGYPSQPPPPYTAKN